MKQLNVFVILLISYSLSAQKPLDFEKLYDFKNGYALVQNGNKKGFIDTDGNLIGEMDVIQNQLPTDGTAYQGKSIYINQASGSASDGVRKYTGEYVVEPEFNIEPFYSFFIMNNYSLKFGTFTTYQVIDEDGNILYSITPKKHIDKPVFPISKTLIGIKNFENDNYSYAIKSLTSDFQSDYIYKEFGTLQNDFIKARRYSEEDGKLKWGFLNEKGEEVIDFIYTTEPSDFSDEKAVVKNTSGLYGYIDTANDIVLEPQFVEAYNFVNGKAVVRIYKIKMENSKSNYGYRLINSKGEILYDFGELNHIMDHGINKFNTIENGHIVRFKLKSMVALFDTESLKIIETPFIKMGRFDSDRALVGFNENKEYKMGYVNERGELLLIKEKKNKF